MGYVIRLKDGRFIIIDGGHYTENAAMEIVKFLAEKAPDPQRIVIAAWFITHAHGDHSGAFQYFAENKSALITSVSASTGKTLGTIELESILFNACDTEEQMQYCTSTTEAIQSAIATYSETYGDVLVYKPLTGQVYTYASTSIEILYTMSDFLPSTIQQEGDVDTKGEQNGDYNIQSVVSIVDIDNTADKSDRFFIMSDTTATACNEMSTRYKDYMKSDYVQAAHHGLNEITGAQNCRRHGATQEIYEYILKDDGTKGLTTVLWPTSAERYLSRIATTVPVNYWLVNTALVREHWIADRSIDYDTQLDNKVKHTYTIEFD